MAEQQIPVEQIGSHSEGLDVEVDVAGSPLDDPYEQVLVYNPELDATNVVPRFAFNDLWSHRGWIEYSLDENPAALEELRAARQDGAPPEDDTVPPDNGDSAAPPEASAKGGTKESGAAAAAKTKE